MDEWLLRDDVDLGAGGSDAFFMAFFFFGGAVRVMTRMRFGMVGLK